MALLPRIKSLSNEGLAKTLDYVQRELGRMTIYEAFKGSAEGQFVLKELRDRREFVRSMYSSLNPSDPALAVNLATLQSYERECDEWIARISDAGVKHGKLQDEANAIQSIIAGRSKQSGSAKTQPKE
jgi:hypothetical protein